MTSVKYIGSQKKSGCSSCGTKQKMVTRQQNANYRVPSEDDPSKQTTISVRNGQVVTLPNNQAKVLLSIVEGNKNVFKLL